MQTPSGGGCESQKQMASYARHLFCSTLGHRFCWTLLHSCVGEVSREAHKLTLSFQEGKGLRLLSTYAGAGTAILHILQIFTTVRCCPTCGGGH